MIVFALIAEAVYDHGVVGVFSSEGLARARATELWAQSDGHHEFRIEPLEVDGLYEPDFTLIYSFLDRTPTKEPPAIKLRADRKVVR